MASTQTVRSSIENVQQVAAFRVALRAFQRSTERAARSAGLTPQWYLLLLVVKGSERGDERATVSELARRMHSPRARSPSSSTERSARGSSAALAPTLDGRVAHIALSRD